MTFSLVQTFRKYKDAYALREGERALLEAAKNRNTPAMLALLEKMPTLLDAPLAFVPGQVERLTIFDFLLQSGAQAESIAAVAAAFPQLLTQTDADGNTRAMRHFRDHWNTNVFSGLAAIIPDKSAANKDGDTLLHLAANRPFHTGAEALAVAIDQNPFIDVRNIKGQTPLMLAASKGQPVLLFLKQHANIHLTDNEGRNAVMYAICHSELDNATLLMQKGAEVDFSDSAIDTQRRVATHEANIDFLKALARQERLQEEKKISLEDATRKKAVQEDSRALSVAMKKGAKSQKAPRTARFSASRKP